MILVFCLQMMWKTDTEELSDSKHVNNFTNTVTVKDEQSDSSSVSKFYFRV